MSLGAFFVHTPSSSPRSLVHGKPSPALGNRGHGNWGGDSDWLGRGRRFASFWTAEKKRWWWLGARIVASGELLCTRTAGKHYGRSKHIIVTSWKNTGGRREVQRVWAIIIKKEMQLRPPLHAQGPHAAPGTFCERLRCWIGDEGLQLGKFSYHGSCLIQYLWEAEKNSQRPPLE